MLGSGSDCGDWADWPIKDPSACAVCPVCDGGGSGPTGTTCAKDDGVCDITITTGAGETGNGSGTAIDGIIASGLCTGAGETEGAGGGLGTVAAGTRPSCGGGSLGSRATGTTGCEGKGVCDIAIAPEAGEIDDSSGTGVDGLRGSGLYKETGGTEETGGGLGTAVTWARPRFVITVTGGAVIGPVCVRVICTVEIDAGTTVICGRTGADRGETGGAGGICWGGGPPCRSHFFRSSVAIRVLMRAMLCCVPAGVSMISLWWRCSWNSGDFSPNVRRMHSRNCNSVLALAASR